MGAKTAGNIPNYQNIAQAGQAQPQQPVVGGMLGGNASTAPKKAGKKNTSPPDYTNLNTPFGNIQIPQQTPAAAPAATTPPAAPAPAPAPAAAPAAEPTLAVAQSPGLQAAPAPTGNDPWQAGEEMEDYRARVTAANAAAANAAAAAPAAAPAPAPAPAAPAPAPAPAPAAPAQNPQEELRNDIEAAVAPAANKPQQMYAARQGEDLDDYQDRVTAAQAADPNFDRDLYQQQLKSGGGIPAEAEANLQQMYAARPGEELEDYQARVYTSGGRPSADRRR